MLIRYIFFTICLPRLGVIKRLLEALKGEAISEDILPYLMETLGSLAKANHNAEAHRSLALFVTDTFHPVSNSLPRTPKPMAVGSRSSTPGNMRRPTLEPVSSSSPARASKAVLKRELGVRILETYTQLLCTRDNLAFIHKFAKTVTNKVITKDMPNGGVLFVPYTNGQNNELVAALFTCRR